MRNRWTAALLVGIGLAAASPSVPPFQDLEASLKGRIGVFALRGGRSLGHRAGERFAYCSTFKWVLGAAVLKAADEGRLDLDEALPYGKADLMEPCPITGPGVEAGRMPIRELCAGTIATSDNPAANLLEARLGGPAALQAFVRGLGDSVMRFDRIEPQLNSNRPGDSRDTTSPEAMARLLRTAFESEALKPESRAQLRAWMEATTTGAKRIKAALPPGWTLAHKTGTGARGAVNDVGVLSPSTGDPIYLCVFVNAPKASDAAAESAIAEAARRVVAAFTAAP